MTILKNDQFNTVVKNAVLNNDITILKDLIQKGVDIRIDNDYLLRAAIFQENLELIQFLTHNGANINVDSGSPLMQSIQKNNIEIVIFLINSGANIYLRGGESLFLSMLEEQYDIISFLLEKGLRLKDIQKDLSIINKNALSFVNKWEEAYCLQNKLSKELEKKDSLLNKKEKI